MVKARLFKKLSILSVIATALVFSFTLTMAAPTYAAANPYTPQEVCGSGYKIQRSHALNGAVAYQLYNGSYNCAVTIKTAQVGTPTRTIAGLRVSGSDWASDDGDYRYYAGPVKQYGKGKCVQYLGYHGGTGYISPMGNCG